MRLALRTWGTGSRTALLVHGYSDDASTWWRVGPALAERGFTVLAPDLRGHGASPRDGDYALEELAQDLLDTLPVDADVAIGHSLGALALGLAAEGLRARRTVYLDPSWTRRRGEVPLTDTLPTTVAELGVGASSWSHEDVAVDLASNARLDPAVVSSLLRGLGPDDLLAPVPPATAGAVVIVPEDSPLLPPETHPLLLSLGYELRTVPGVGHVMHRDDLTGFLTVLDDVLDLAPAVGRDR